MESVGAVCLRQGLGVPSRGEGGRRWGGADHRRAALSLVRQEKVRDASGIFGPTIGIWPNLQQRNATQPVRPSVSPSSRGLPLHLPVLHAQRTNFLQGRVSLPAQPGALPVAQAVAVFVMQVGVVAVAHRLHSTFADECK